MTMSPSHRSSIARCGWSLMSEQQTEAHSEGALSRLCIVHLKPVETVVEGRVPNSRFFLEFILRDLINSQ